MLEQESVIEQLKGQLTRHACAGGQNASCARVVGSHFAELTIDSLLFVRYLYSPSSLCFLISFRTSPCKKVRDPL